MSEYEMNGLRVIVDEAVERGTLHVLAPEPRRADYTTDGDYRRAYREWWRKMNCWTTKGRTGGVW